MSKVSGYVLSIFCACLICSIVGSLTKDRKQTNVMLQLLSGIFLSITVITPLKHFTLPSIDNSLNAIDDSGRQICSAAQMQANAEIKSIIKQRLEAYILEKADQLGVTLETDITLSDTLIPESVTVSGRVTPFEKQQLEHVLTQDLGIAKEDQSWR